MCPAARRRRRRAPPPAVPPPHRHRPPRPRRSHSPAPPTAPRRAAPRPPPAAPAGARRARAWPRPRPPRLPPVAPASARRTARRRPPRRWSRPPADDAGGVEPPITNALEAGLDHIRRAPTDRGRVELIVRRPAENEREVLAIGVLDRSEGLVGDTWRVRPSMRTPDGSAHPDMQLNVMSSRVAQLVAGRADRWQLAGDQ